MRARVTCQQTTCSMLHSSHKSLFQFYFSPQPSGIVLFSEEMLYNPFDPSEFTRRQLSSLLFVVASFGKTNLSMAMSTKMQTQSLCLGVQRALSTQVHWTTTTTRSLLRSSHEDSCLASCFTWFRSEK